MRSTDYREADRIVTLLTPDLGKIGAVARGVRSSRRRFGGCLQSCTLLRVDLDTTRNALWSLKRVDLERHYPTLMSRLKRITLAGEMTELVRELSAEDVPDPELFRTLNDALVVLDRRSINETVVLPAFALRLISELGLPPGIHGCDVCGRSVPEGRATLFDARHGAVRCRNCGGGRYRLSPAVRARWQACFEPQWADLVSEASLTSADFAWDAVLAMLRHHAGKPLLSSHGALAE